MSDSHPAQKISPLVLRELYQHTWYHNLKIPLFYAMIVGAGYVAWNTEQYVAAMAYVRGHRVLVDEHRDVHARLHSQCALQEKVEKLGVWHFLDTADHRHVYFVQRRSFRASSL